MRLDALRRLATALLACALGAYATVVLVGTTFVAGDPPLADFGSFYASGQAGAQGLDPYDVYPLTMDAALGRGNGAAINLNAPVSVLVFQALTLMDPTTARRVWLFATLAAYALMVGLLMRSSRAFRGPLVVAWVLAFTGLIETVVLGQVYAFLALLATLAWLLMPRFLLAACLIGFLVAFKPNFVVWPLMLWLAGYRKVGVLALAWALAFGLLPVLVYGVGVYAEWLATLRLEAVNAQVANASVPGLLVRTGVGQSVAVGFGALVLLGLGVWAWRRRPSIARCSGVAVVGLLLGSPLAWVGYSLFVLPSFGRAGRWTPALVVAAALLCVPRLPLQQAADASALVRVTLGAAFSVAWVIVLAHEVLMPPHADRAEHWPP